MPEQPYTDVKAAYQLHFNFLFGTRRSRDVLHGKVREQTIAICDDVCERFGYHKLDIEAHGDRLEAFLSLKPEHTISKTVQMLKGNISRTLFQEFPDLEQQIGRRNLWAGSYRVYSSGVATTAAIKAYLDSQYEHHAMTKQTPRALARYAAPDRESYLQFRKSRHAVYLLHYHYVFSVKHHAHVLEEEKARYLVDLMRRICETKGYALLTLEVAENHMHGLLSLGPKDAPQEVALSVLNNTSYLALRQFERLATLYPDGRLWMPSYFVRSVRSKTTAQVRSYFRHG
jgi:putative transposase